MARCSAKFSWPLQARRVLGALGFEGFRVLGFFAFKSVGFKSFGLRVWGLSDYTV